MAPRLFTLTNTIEPVCGITATGEVCARLVPACGGRCDCCTRALTTDEGNTFPTRWSTCVEIVDGTWTIDCFPYLCDLQTCCDTAADSHFWFEVTETPVWDDPTVDIPACGSTWLVMGCDECITSDQLTEIGMPA